MLDVDQPDHNTDDGNDLGQNVTKLVQLLLEGGRLGDLRGDALVDVANCGIRSGQDNNRVGVSSDDGSTREKHVDLILLDSLIILDGVRLFANTLALTSQDTLVDAKAIAVDAEQSAIGGNLVSNRYINHISRDQLFRLDALNLSITNDLGGVGTVFLEGSNSLFGRAFLAHTDDCVEDEDGEDDGRIDECGPALAVFEQGEYERNGRRPEQDEHQLVFELLEYELPEGGGRIFGDGWIDMSVSLCCGTDSAVMCIPFLPCFCREDSTPPSDSPLFSDTPKCFNTSCVERTYAFSMTDGYRC